MRATRPWRRGSMPSSRKPRTTRRAVAPASTKVPPPAAPKAARTPRKEAPPAPREDAAPAARRAAPARPQGPPAAPGAAPAASGPARRGRRDARDLIAVDVGNSETVVGRFRGGELESHWRLTSGRQTADEIVLTLSAL